jgi:predicted nuclease of predicted toxin-antitoxin system
MRFLGDMGVSWRVIEWLRAGGHDAVHLRDEGLQRLPNGDIFQKGFAEQRSGSC